jgi:hypothetical protein
MYTCRGPVVSNDDPAREELSTMKLTTTTAARTAIGSAGAGFA